MRTALVYLVLVATPAGAFALARSALVRFTRGGRHRTAVVPPGRPLERLAADLRRLERDYRATERSDHPAKTSRLRAIGLAYDDTLRDCCRALGLPEPRPAPLDAVSRLQTEAALAQHGVAW